MNNLNLTKDEESLLKQYQVLSEKPMTNLNRLAVEIVPPVFFVVIAFITGQDIFFVFVIAMLVFYNVFRIIKQRTTIFLLKSISVKAIGDISKGGSDAKT